MSRKIFRLVLLGIAISIFLVVGAIAYFLYFQKAIPQVKQTPIVMTQEIADKRFESLPKAEGKPLSEISGMLIDVRGTVLTIKTNSTSTPSTYTFALTPETLQVISRKVVKTNSIHMEPVLSATRVKKGTNVTILVDDMVEQQNLKPLQVIYFIE